MDDPLTIAGVRRRHDGAQGQWIKLSPTGELFRALVAAHPPVELNTELGYDPRMASLMEVLNERVPPSLKALNAKANVVVLDSKGQKYNVVTRTNNATDCVHVFLIIQQSGRDNIGLGSSNPVYATQQDQD